MCICMHAVLSSEFAGTVWTTYSVCQYKMTKPLEGWEIRISDSKTRKGYFLNWSLLGTDKALRQPNQLKALQASHLQCNRKKREWTGSYWNTYSWCKRSLSMVLNTKPHIKNRNTQMHLHLFTVETDPTERCEAVVPLPLRNTPTRCL